MCLNVDVSIQRSKLNFPLTKVTRIDFSNCVLSVYLIVYSFGFTFSCLSYLWIQSWPYYVECVVFHWCMVYLPVAVFKKVDCLNCYKVAVALQPYMELMPTSPFRTGIFPLNSAQPLYMLSPLLWIHVCCFPNVSQKCYLCVIIHPLGSYYHYASSSRWRAWYI